MESQEIRCCGCGRLLFKITGGSLGCTVQIRCPRCRQFNLLRPESPSPKRQDRDGKALTDAADTRLEPVDPALPVAPWLGGKRNLASRIIARIDAIPHVLYAEAFLGMGGVFLRRSRRPRAEAINDISKDIATLFRILQRHYPQFLDTLRFQLTTRFEYYRLIETRPETLTDLERAARFLYLQRTAFGGHVSGKNFGVQKDRPARFNLTTLEPMLEDLHTRLAGVVIECLPWADFITRYDAPGTLFYLDPPYWGNETDYGKGIFGRADFERMAGVLRGLKGRFILSINDVPQIRETFAGFAIEEVETTYTINSGPAQPGRKELLICGPHASVVD